MYARQACSTLQRLARGFPILALTGPMADGKARRAARITHVPEDRHRLGLIRITARHTMRHQA